MSSAIVSLGLGLIGVVVYGLWALLLCVTAYGFLIALGLEDPGDGKFD